MSSHAGYSVALTMPEKIANLMINSYFYFGKQDFSYFFVPDSPITVGPIQVSLSGLFRLLLPRLEFHSNNQQRVDAFFSLTGIINIGWTGSAIRKFELKLDTQISIPVAAQTDGNDIPIEDRKIFLVFDFSQIEIEQLSVTSISGPPITQLLLDVFNTSQIKNSLNQFLRENTEPRLTVPILNSFFYKAVPNFQEFAWFSISLIATNIDVKVVDQGVTVGIDYSKYPNNNGAYTSGEINQLENLSTGNVGAYKTIITTSSLPNDKPVLLEISQSKLNHIAIAINLSFISAMIADQVSPDISGTNLPGDQAEIESMSFSPSLFNNERTGQPNQRGVETEISITVRQFFDADVRMRLQAYLQTYSEDFGSTYYLKKEYWKMAITSTNVDYPLYIDFGLGVLQFLELVFLTPFTFLTLFKLFGRPSIFSVLGDAATSADEAFNLIVDQSNNAANLAYFNATGIVNSFAEPWSTPLPYLDKPNWNWNYQWVAFTEEAFEIGIRTYPEWSELIDDKPLVIITPESISAAFVGYIPIQLKLREDLHKMSLHDSLFVDWQIRRTDNGDIVYSTSSPYTYSEGSRISFKRHTEDLYVVSNFVIRASVKITLNGTTGEVWNGEQALPVDDVLDRNFQFVKWGPHIAHFHKPGSVTEWWSHVRRSRIHRTAVAARCKVLKENAEIQFYSGNATFTYFDKPEIWDNLALHRHAICEYCFFGGPDKFAPFPKEDWFLPQGIENGFQFAPINL